MNGRRIGWFHVRCVALRWFLVVCSILTIATSAGANPSKGAKAGDPAKDAQVIAVKDDGDVQPFASNLFQDSYQRQHEDGLNPHYVVMPGDRVVVNTWGALELKEVFVVDGQGNIFLPSIGPVHLAGVKNQNLTQTLRASITNVYRSNVGVYTNLLTAAPVGVFVTGGVNRPGRYAGVPSDSVLFFLNQAGGIDPDLGSYRDIALLRGGQEVAHIDLYQFVLTGALPTIQFTDGDTILVRRRGVVVHLQGSVASEALIEFADGQTLGSDALAVVPAAGSATEVTIIGLRDSKPFRKTLQMEEFRSFVLHNGDIIEFREEGLADSILVRLEGEFIGPTLLSVKRGARLLDVLNHVPVNSELADPSSVHLRRRSVAQAQKRTIDDSLFRLERSALLALSATEREASIRVKEAELMKSFVETARLIQPLGRVVTSVKGKQLNVLLQDGDVVVIPSNTNVVRVGGEVQMTQAVVYTPGRTTREYVEAAGGYTERSNQSKVIILHASAEVTMGDQNSIIRPGDEILVPPEVDSKLLQNAADVTQVLYQIAVAAAVVIAL